MAKSGMFLAFSAALLIGCASPLQDRKTPEPIVSEQGHVIGHKDFRPDPRSGEQVAVPVYYTPRHDAAGTVVAYEEPVPEGVVIRAVDGRRIGVRYHDLRSRGSNQNNEGVTVTLPREGAAK